MCSCEHLRGRTRAWSVHRDVKSELCFSLSAMHRYKAPVKITVSVGVARTSERERENKMQGNRKIEGEKIDSSLWKD